MTISTCCNCTMVGLDTLRRDPLILESLEQFKAQGKIRCIGISLNNPCDALDPLIVEHFEVIQTNFSLLDMRLLTNGFLKSENAKKVGVLARTPFNFGFLANNFPPDVRFDSRDHRSKWPKSQLLSWINGANGVLRSLKISDLNSQEERVKLALGFCLSFQRISSTLAGMTTPEEVMLNVKSLQHCKLDGDLLISAQEFYKSWEKNKAELHRSVKVKLMLAQGHIIFADWRNYGTNSNNWYFWSGASYLAEHLAKVYPKAEIHGVTRWHSTSTPKNLEAIKDRVTLHECDLCDFSSLINSLNNARPSHIFHLASHANVRAGFTTPLSVLNNNIMGTANLFEGIRCTGLDPLIQLCSTSEVYGQVSPENVPINEDCPQRSSSPYAVSKTAQDHLGFTYFTSYGLRVVTTRMFAYFNPRRADSFSTSFAKQVALIEALLEENKRLSSTEILIP